MAISVTDAALGMEKKAIGRCARRGTLRNCVVWIYCCIILASLSTFFIFWCTDMLHNCVLSQLVLRNGTHTFAWWQRRPVNLTCKIYIFNYTNVDDFQAGRASKLRVQEIGPYVYQESLNRVNVKMHENGTISYQEKRSYEWHSGNSVDETLVVPNVPFMSAISYVKDLGFAVQIGLTTILSTLQEQPFIRESADGYMWGYENPLFRVAKPLLAWKHEIPIDRFGLMAMKKGVDKDRITIHTGSQDLNSLGMIERVNGIDARNIWGDKKCDKIGGTDGSMFSPHLIKNPNNTLYIYSKELCRKVPFRYTEQVITYDMPCLRYKLSSDAFNSTTTQNECYCAQTGSTRVCPPAGILNMSACNYDTPLLASLPHFYSGDESLLESVDGLHPRQEDHETYMDIHPNLAIPIAGWSRLQMNLEVKRATAVPFLGRLKEGTILPLLWVALGTEEVPDSVLKMLHMAHFTLAAVEASFQWCSLIIAVLSSGALINYLKKHRADDRAQRNSSGQGKLLK